MTFASFQGYKFPLWQAQLNQLIWRNGQSCIKDYTLLGNHEKINGDAPEGLCLLPLSEFCSDSDTHLERWHLIFKLLTELRSQGETQPYAEQQVSLLMHILLAATTEDDEDRTKPLIKMWERHRERRGSLNYLLFIGVSLQCISWDNSEDNNSYLDWAAPSSPDIRSYPQPEPREIGIDACLFRVGFFKLSWNDKARADQKVSRKLKMQIEAFIKKKNN